MKESLVLGFQIRQYLLYYYLLDFDLNRDIF